MFSVDTSNFQTEKIREEIEIFVELVNEIMEDFNRQVKVIHDRLDRI